MTDKQVIGYEILPRETVEKIRAEFHASLEQKAKKAVGEGLPEPDELSKQLKKLLIAAHHKGLEVKATDLAALAKAGPKAIAARTEQIDDMLHVGSPDESKFPSPHLFSWQLRRAREVAKDRLEDASVRQTFGDDDRLYLKFQGAVDAPASDTQKEVAHWLEQAGYRMVDYAGGYATDAAGKQQFKIGKLLKDDEVLKEKFRVDPMRALGSLMVVISRNAKDIAEMATGRAWSSCMGSRGCNFEQYMPQEIRKGSLVAYLVSEKDPEILNPLARIVIKPYVQKLSVKGALKIAANALFRRRESRPELFVPAKIYGLPNNAFPAAVTSFVEEKLNVGKEGEFNLPEQLYPDGLPPTQIRRDGQKLAARGLSLNV